jgi:TetR/AcrR family transcriptional regulator
MAYYRAEPVNEDSRSKRQHILAAAYEVFSRKGYHRATVDEIIAMADTGKGTVYNYFSNKEQLFYTLVRERSQPFEDALQQLAESDQAPLVKVETAVRLSLRFYSENADLWRVLMHEIRGFGSEGHSNLTPENRQKYCEGFRRVIGSLEVILQDGIDKGLLRQLDVTKSAYALFSVTLMMVYQKFVGEDFEGTARNITDMFMNGAAKR